MFGLLDCHLGKSELWSLIISLLTNNAILYKHIYCRDSTDVYNTYILSPLEKEKCKHLEGE